MLDDRISQNKYFLSKVHNKNDVKLVKIEIHVMIALKMGVGLGRVVRAVRWPPEVTGSSPSCGSESTFHSGLLLMKFSTARGSST
jgi:hypothetical protein